MSAIIEDAEEIKASIWGTLNTATSSGKLPEGHSPSMNNVWVDEKPGSVITSNGYVKLGQLPSGNPVTFLLNFFKSSDGSSTLICSDGQNVYKTTDYVNYTSIKTGLSPYFQLRGAVVRDKVWLTNGSDSVMTYDGSTLATLDGTGGTPNVPKGKFIAYHDERVWMFGISGDLSAVRFSALADSTGAEITPDDADAWPTDNEIQISEGDADIGTGIFSYRGYLYCSKQYSIWRIVGDDEYSYSRVKTRASSGTRFQESIQIKDNLVHFIGVDGLYTFDGEDALRISDIIDPTDPDEGQFAFRNLQQPLLNNQFWSVSATADFNAGTVPAVISSSDDKLTLSPADDSQADFASGTHDDTTATANSGNLQLDLVASGAYGSLVSSGKTPSIYTPSGSVVGVASYINDGNTNNYCGFKYTASPSSRTFYWALDLGVSYSISRIVIKSFYTERPGATSILDIVVQSSSDGSSWTDRGSLISQLSSQYVISSLITFPGESGTARGPSDLTLDISTTSARYWRLVCDVTSSGSVGFLLKEIEIYGAAYETDGKFISKSIDYGVAPATFGTLAAAITTNGENYQFFTQSSSDGSTWDGEVNVSNGASIGSSLKRYLRWGVYLYSSDGTKTPVVDKVYVGGTYLSSINDTGGNIYQWGAFQSDYFKAGQTIRFYFRGATTSGGVASESWTEIVPGAIPSLDVTDDNVQVKIEMSTTDATQIPNVESHTMNWILANATGVNTLQNVASIVIFNRYWLAAATVGAAENDIVLILGRNTFNSPWMKKDFKVLSFTRFLDYYIAGSSEDGSIYRLESTYSKNGSAMDSYFETGDFSKEGFFIKGYEILVDVDRTGPWDLSVGYSTDSGETWTEKTVDLTRGSGERISYVARLNVSFMSDQVRMRVRVNAADQPFTVNDLKLYYRLTPQRGSLE